MTRRTIEGRSVQVGGYGAFGIAGGFVQAYAGYGWDKHDIDRAGVVEDMEADPQRQPSASPAPRPAI